MKRYLSFIISLAFIVIFLIFTKFYNINCSLPAYIKDFRNYHPMKYEAFTVPKLTFNFKGYIFAPLKGRKKASLSEMIENLKISVITGRKRYILLDSVFIEEGKEYNGIKFLGLDDGKVVLEVNGKLYKKRF